MMKNRHLSLISVVCLTSICFISLLWPAIAFSLTEDCVAEGTDGSLVQSGQEAFGTSGSDRLTLDSDNFKASIDSSIYEYTGDVITPDVSVLTASGSVLASGIDYEVTCSDNVAPGCATITPALPLNCRSRSFVPLIITSLFLVLGPTKTVNGGGDMRLVVGRQTVFCPLEGRSIILIPKVMQLLAGNT